MGKTPPVGTLVSTTLTGRIIGADADQGHVYLEGSAAGGHVPWKYTLHWATEFTPSTRSVEDAAEESCEGELPRHLDAG